MYHSLSIGRHQETSSIWQSGGYYRIKSFHNIPVWLAVTGRPSHSLCPEGGGSRSHCEIWGLPMMNMILPVSLGELSALPTKSPSLPLSVCLPLYLSLFSLFLSLCLYFFIPSSWYICLSFSLSLSLSLSFHSVSVLLCLFLMIYMSVSLSLSFRSLSLYCSVSSSWSLSLSLSLSLYLSLSLCLLPLVVSLQC